MFPVILLDESRGTPKAETHERTMRDRLRDPHAPNADVTKKDRQFADQHPTPNDYSPGIVKPGTGAQAKGQITRS